MIVVILFAIVYTFVTKIIGYENLGIIHEPDAIYLRYKISNNNGAHRLNHQEC